jgi:hypothetical protein
MNTFTHTNAVADCHLPYCGRASQTPCRRTHIVADLLAFMNYLADRYASSKQIIVVLTNLNIHYNGPSGPGAWQ